MRRQLEAKIHLIRTDVQQDIARRPHGAARTRAELTKRVQRCRTRGAEEPIPSAGTKAAYAGQITGGDAMANRANQGGNVRAPSAHRVGMAVTGRKRRDNEDSAARDGAAYGLGFGRVIRHWIDRYRDVFRQERDRFTANENTRLSQFSFTLRSDGQLHFVTKKNMREILFNN
ncbi:hypothetical protein LT85_4207 [Collimonas arenae]|uniref:Uncharacterized protein n=1 Tax=Collimonas arenae TaxID=279058 RepID=A0A0A1FI37_9BURK|nr:hypothetical protein LT85_4207 [Collimonas arenae]